MVQLITSGKQRESKDFIDFFCAYVSGKCIGRVGDENGANPTEF